jgi:hypothetical protein
MALKWCPKYKINIEETSEHGCQGCIFKKEVKSALIEETVWECWFENWFPALKKGREW